MNVPDRFAALGVAIACAFAAAGCRAPVAAQPAFPPADTAAAIASHRAWWQALVLADTAYLRARSASGLVLTLSSGRTFDRDGALREAASHSTGARLTTSWLTEEARPIGPDAIVVTSRLRESEGTAAMTYRYLTVLRRDAAREWHVLPAQSTREAAFTPRVPAAAAGVLADFAGTYRTPRGGALRVVAHDSLLALVEPSGAQLPLEPIGPGLFEFGALSASNGVVRFVFTRDAAGRVAALTRLVPGTVTTFPRAP